MNKLLPTPQLDPRQGRERGVVEGESHSDDLSSQTTLTAETFGKDSSTRLLGNLTVFIGPAVLRQNRRRCRLERNLDRHLPLHEKGSNPSLLDLEIDRRHDVGPRARQT